MYLGGGAIKRIFIFLPQFKIVLNIYMFISYGRDRTGNCGPLSYLSTPLNRETEDVNVNCTSHMCTNTPWVINLAVEGLLICIIVMVKENQLLRCSPRRSVYHHTIILYYSL